MGKANLLVIMLDEWRQAAMGAGPDPVHTPVIDALAAAGSTFTHAVSNYPVCSPQRAMFMSGRYPHANGVTANCNSVTSPHQQLRPDLRCWSDVLRDVGYRCGYIGKWHLDAPTDIDVRRERLRGRKGIAWDAFPPPERRHGFGYWDGYGSSNDHFHTMYWRTDDRTDVPGGMTEADGEVYEGWSPRHDTDSALEFLRTRRPDEPWALMVSYNPPHMPFDQGPDAWKDVYAGIAASDLLTRPNVPVGHHRAEASVANYFALLSGVDAEIGRLLDGLGDDLDDTLVVVTADHGEMLGSHGLMGKNVWYDESLLVPLIVRWPGVVPVGTNDVLISAPDFYRTMLSLIGVSDDPRAAIPADLHGRDLSVPVRHPGDDPQPGVALYISRQADWNLDADGTWLNDRDERGIRTHRWLYVHRRSPREEHLLFDVESDPYQLDNVYTHVLSAHPEIVQSLQGLLSGELQRIGDPWASSARPGDPALSPSLGT